MADVRCAKVLRSALLTALAVLATWVVICGLTPGAALADDRVTEAVQVVDVADEMGPGPFGEPLAAQAEAIDQIVFGTNKSVRLTTWLPFLKGSNFDFLQTVCPVSHETLADGTEVYAIGLNRMSSAVYADILTGKQTIYKSAIKNSRRPGRAPTRGPSPHTTRCMASTR